MNATKLDEIVLHGDLDLELSDLADQVGRSMVRLDADGRGLGTGTV